MAQGEQQARKKRKAADKPAKSKKRQLEEAEPVPQQATAPQDGPSGWEELEQPQDVQQQAGAPPQAPGRGTGIIMSGESIAVSSIRGSMHACHRRRSPPPPLLPPPLPAAPADMLPRPARPCACAEPQAQQQQEPRKLSKLQKRRVKEDRERAIREAEMKKLEVRAKGRGMQPFSQRASEQEEQHWTPE